MNASRTKTHIHEYDETRSSFAFVLWAWGSRESTSDSSVTVRTCLRFRRLFQSMRWRDKKRARDETDSYTLISRIISRHKKPRVPSGESWFFLCFTSRDRGMLPSLFFSEIIQKCALYTSSILFHKSSLKLRMIQDKKAVFHFARYYIPVKDLCLNKAVLRAKTWSQCTSHSI